jgi:hypothetical protein
MWTCILAVAFQFPGLALIEGASSFVSALPAFLSLAAACLVYIMMAGALAVRLKANGVAVLVAAAAVAGFLMPVGFLVPDMRVFWLEEGSVAVHMPIIAATMLVALWGAIGCISLEKKELG